MSTCPFASNVRKFVRVPGKEIFGNLVFYLQKDLNASVESEEEKMLIVAKLRGMTKLVGFTVLVRIFPEAEASAIQMSFGYKGFFVAAFTFLTSIVILSVALFSLFPLLGVFLLLLLMRDLGSTSSSFLHSFNDFLLLLERDRDQRLLAEDRKRWQADLGKTDEIYRRLLEKHIKIWGDSHVLEYKVNEYIKQGLTREEAIRKVAEEEGIF